MALEQRSGGSYYYRKERRGARVVSVYVGAGLIAQMQHGLDKIEALARREQQAQRRAEQQAAGQTAIGDRALAREAAQLAALALLATGYHQHKGQWRKRRKDMDMATTPRAALTDRLAEQVRAEQERRASTKERAALPPLPPADDTSQEAITAVFKRCNRADATPEDIAALRRLLKSKALSSDKMGLIRTALDHTIAEMRHSYTALTRELSDDHIYHRRAELGYKTAPALERPLIDHLLLCELRMGQAEHIYSAKTSGSLSLEAARYYEQRLSATQQRYLRAVETLARVRRVRVALARLLPDGSAQSVEIDSPGA